MEPRAKAQLRLGSLTDAAGSSAAGATVLPSCLAVLLPIPLLFGGSHCKALYRNYREPTNNLVLVVEGI